LVRRPARKGCSRSSATAASARISIPPSRRRGVVCTLTEPR
jgi:hypothetical protein